MADKWSTTWDKDPNIEVVNEAHKRFMQCEDWEAQARTNFDFDYKFANGDAHNNYQWDEDLYNNREFEDRPCLTINKTKVHNLMVINDAKQNKPGVRIRPVGDEATYEAAQIYQELIYHIEYISNAENVYDNATSFQVEGGIGYWRITTDYVNTKSFDQEIYIRRIKDPRSVYLDPFINEVDGSDARFGIIFDDMAKDLFDAAYPKVKDEVGASNFGTVNGWIGKDMVRVAEYFRKEEKEDKLVTFVTDTHGQIIKHLSELEGTELLIYKEIKKDKNLWQLYKFKERKVITDTIQWYKIAGDKVIDDKIWPGKYIPIVRLLGSETVIDGIMDRKGHTRALINAQQIYNYQTSANVEFGALQTKSPWIASAQAIEGFEEYYKTSNSINHSYLPYNGLDDEGHPIAPPSRPQGPQPGMAYIEGMKIAQNEMMMATGQYQAQFGENENAKSGVAINSRQRQGDRATYHFIDNLAIAIRFTGKILLDLIPKIYDTKRVMRITGMDGKIMDVTIDPKAEQGFQKSPDKTIKDKSEVVHQILFNPNVGEFDVQSDTGPSYATKRMEAATALTQLAAADKEFMKVGGDVYFEMLDFPKADVLASRYKRMIPPSITGDEPDPQTEEMMHKASDHIEMLTGQVADLTKQLSDKEKELAIKAQTLDLNFKKGATDAARLDYEAETKRLTALGNSGPAVAVEQIQPVLQELLAGMIANGELVFKQPGVHEGGTVAGAENEPTGEAPTVPVAPANEEPPVEGAKKAKDGAWYINDPDRQGKYLRVE